MATHMAGTPDEVLVVAAILGDFAAFDELVRRYRATVVRTAQALVGPADAEDVAQDALLLAFKALPSIDDPARFAPWLMVITRHRALRVGRQERRRRAGQVALDAVLRERLGALTPPLVRRHELQDELDRALARVPDGYALVLRLRFLDGVPLRRIAAFLDLPVSTVKGRLYRGKRLLREALERINTPTWTEN